MSNRAERRRKERQPASPPEPPPTGQPQAGFTVSPDDLIYKIGLLTIERDHLIQTVRRLEEHLQRLAGEVAEKAEGAAKAVEPPPGKK